MKKEEEKEEIGFLAIIVGFLLLIIASIGIILLYVAVTVFPLIVIMWVFWKLFL